MHVLTEMDLPLLPHEGPEFSADPEPFMARARQHHPWLARSNLGGFVVHGYEPARDIIGMDDNTHPFFPNFAEVYDAVGTGWGNFMSQMMNATSGDKHRRLRNSAQAAFTPRAVNAHRELMREVMHRLLDEWAADGSLDFAEFAAWYPITVFCGLLGVSPDVVPSIRKALEAQTSSVALDPALRPRIMAAFEVLWDFVDRAVKEREAAGGGTAGVIDTMLASRDAGMIDDVELRQNLIMFAAGGYDTSKNMLGLAVRLLLDHPEMWQRCAEDIGYCRKVATEALRHSGIATVYRVAARDFTYDGVLFPQGTMLILMVSMAGRDPDRFADPLAFDPDRANASQHLAFGRGEHHCIGMHLARAQIEEGLHVVTQRLRQPRLAGTPQYRPYLGVWGLESLPIAFEV